MSSSSPPFSSTKATKVFNASLSSVKPASKKAVCTCLFVDPMPLKSSAPTQHPKGSHHRRSCHVLNKKHDRRSLVAAMTCYSMIMLYLAEALPAGIVALSDGHAWPCPVICVSYMLKHATERWLCATNRILWLFTVSYSAARRVWAISRYVYSTMRVLHTYARPVDSANIHTVETQMRKTFTSCAHTGLPLTCPKLISCFPRDGSKLLH